MGLLGKNIPGTDYSFNISIVKGAGAFVCGEETALSGPSRAHGEPRRGPRSPSQGVYGRPT
jgi:NADH-quinone oxidoreductase subunit F